MATVPQAGHERPPTCTDAMSTSEFGTHRAQTSLEPPGRAQMVQLWTASRSSALLLVGGFEFCWQDFPPGLVEPTLVETVGVFPAGDLDLLRGPPEPMGLDQLCLEQSGDRLD